MGGDGSFDESQTTIGSWVVSVLRMRGGGREEGKQDERKSSGQRRLLTSCVCGAQSFLRGIHKLLRYPKWRLTGMEVYLLLLLLVWKGRRGGEGEEGEEEEKGGHTYLTAPRPSARVEIYLWTW